jgi:hypothetical protein
MTFDQAQKAFREHKASKTADAYLENALHDNADKAIGDDTFFNAVGEVASWLSASVGELPSLFDLTGLPIEPDIFVILH